MGNEQLKEKFQEQLLFAVENNDIDVVRKILNGIDNSWLTNIKDDVYAKNIFHLVAENNGEEILKIFIWKNKVQDMKNNINDLSFFATTALHEAIVKVKENKYNLIKMLLYLGADPHKESEPYALVERNPSKNYEISLLANPTEENKKKRKNCFDLARSNKNNDILKILNEFQNPETKSNWEIEFTSAMSEQEENEKKQKLSRQKELEECKEIIDKLQKEINSVTSEQKENSIYKIKQIQYETQVLKLINIKEKLEKLNEEPFNIINQESVRNYQEEKKLLENQLKAEVKIKDRLFLELEQVREQEIKLKIKQKLQELQEKRTLKQQEETEILEKIKEIKDELLKSQSELKNKLYSVYKKYNEKCLDVIKLENKLLDLDEQVLAVDSKKNIKKYEENKEKLKKQLQEEEKNKSILFLELKKLSDLNIKEKEDRKRKEKERKEQEELKLQVKKLKKEALKRENERLKKEADDLKTTIEKMQFASLQKEKEKLVPLLVKQSVAHQKEEKESESDSIFPFESLEPKEKQAKPLPVLGDGNCLIYSLILSYLGECKNDKSEFIKRAEKMFPKLPKDIKSYQYLFDNFEYFQKNNEKMSSLNLLLRDKIASYIKENLFVKFPKSASSIEEDSNFFNFVCLEILQKRWKKIEQLEERLDNINKKLLNFPNNKTLINAHKLISKEIKQKQDENNLFQNSNQKQKLNEVNKYLKNLRKSGTWCTSLEISTFCNLFETKVTVNNVQSFIPIDEKVKPKIKIDLAYTNGNHYSYFLPEKQAQLVSDSESLPLPLYQNYGEQLGSSSQTLEPVEGKKILKQEQLEPLVESSTEVPMALPG